ncbi:MAG: branched-chain amino acid ABC transporter permease [Clostridia bacterium]|nr:branched-chain amino acid ABC transporter permease [Clostridia bacterium]
MFAAFVSMLCGSLLNICITGLSAFAVTLIFKTSTTTNFAQGSIATLGCYVTAELFRKAGVPVWLGLFPGLLTGLLCGLLVDIIIFRRGKNVNPVGKQIITMGLVSIIFGGIPLLFGNPESIPFEPFYNALAAGKAPNLFVPFAGGELVVTKHALICLAITAVVLGTLFALLRFSKWGLAVRATASNEYTAQLMGINSHSVTAVSWALAGALGVLAAVMYAGGGAKIGVSFMTTIQVNAFLAGILGGFSTFHGPVAGAVCIQLTASCVGFLANIPGLSGITRWNMVIVYALMLVVILIRPQGLMGKPVMKKV